MIIINFIIKLLLLKELLIKVLYNSILTVIDQLIKETRFISYLKVLNTEELAYTFLQNIIVFNKLSEKIISDRDKLFILNF